MTVRSASVLVAAACFVASVAGITTHVPEPNPPLNPNPTDTNNPNLVGKAFNFADLPPHVDTSGPQPNVVYRGPQAGTNICNSTTEGQDSMCQTLQINSITDFCIWAPPKPNSTIGDTEGEEVAWCSKKGHGARLIPPGAVTGLQFVHTQSYVMMTGHMNLPLVNIFDDGGGEMDSGGQDNRGNPIGGAAYSNSLPSSNGQLTQSRTWHFFIGGGVFCMKFCDPKAPDALGLCQHTFDTIGCNYNVPAAYQDGVFLSCQGEDQDPVAVYTGADGQISTLPHFSEGQPIPQLPFTPRIPATSSCTTFQSAQIFTDQASLSTTTSSSPSTSPTPSSGAPASASSGAGQSGSSSTGAPAKTSGAARPGVGSASSSALVAGLVAGAAILVGAAIVA